MAPHRPSTATYPCKVTGEQIEGAAGPPSRARRVSRNRVSGAASRDWHRPRRTVPHSGGDGFPPRELVQRNRGACPRRIMAPPRRGQSIKCPCTGTGVRVRGALERGGARSRAERTLERGGACSRQAHSLERGGARPRKACALERGGACSRVSLSGPPWWAVGATMAWAVPCVLKRGAFGLGLLWVLSGDSPVV
jgi:hypothetical protein